MTHNDFNHLLHNTIMPEVVRKLTVKSEEYARGENKLHNFVRAGAMKDETPEQALWGMNVKHIISIQDFIKDRANGKTHDLELWKEKITDEIAYQCLLFAIEADEQLNRVPEIGCGSMTETVLTRQAKERKKYLGDEGWYKEKANE